MMRVSAGRPDIQTNDMEGRGGDKDANYESGTQGSAGYSSIEEMDPSLAEGFRVIYDREVPVESRMEEDGEGARVEIASNSYRFKVLILVETPRACTETIYLFLFLNQARSLSVDSLRTIITQGEENFLDSLKVEVSSESDLFFHAVLQLDQTTFHEVAESQKLNVEFMDFPAVVIRMLNNCIKEPQNYLVGLVKVDHEHLKLEFIQNIGIKFIELLSLQFIASAEEVVRKQVTYRYNSLKARVFMMQTRLQEINTLVRIRNPSLLLQLGGKPSTPQPGSRSRHRNLDHSI